MIERLCLASAILASALLAVGCGGSRSYTSASTALTALTAPPTQATAAGTARASSATTTTAPVGAIAVTLADYRITPAAITAHAGHIVLVVTNAGQTPHNFTVTSPDGRTVTAASRELMPGKAEDVKVDLAAGTYPFSCTEPGHASLGMTGLLTVD